MIERLQRHEFKFEDKPFDVLEKDYPGCKSALQWWCNSNGEGSRFNIAYNKWLKEFIIANPPTFKISPKCCNYAKKSVAHKYVKDNQIDLSIYGVRKSEGGLRATMYDGCFSEGDFGCAEYRPLFWYKDQDRKEYEEYYGIVHSECYTEYGLKRTGCAGCPFGRDFEFELSVIEKYEPKLLKAVNNIFADSYEYTRKYRQFVREMNERSNQQITEKN